MANQKKYHQNPFKIKKTKKKSKKISLKNLHAAMIQKMEQIFGPFHDCIRMEKRRSSRLVETIY